jgi:MoaA/NifB/PqqE/SkfB family radical SAM enzyme
VNINNGGSVNYGFSHPSRLELLKSFDENKQHPSCESCWKDKTQFSPRVLFSVGTYGLATTKEAYQSKEKPITSKLEYLEIKAGNRCNLKCRICGYNNSSQWTVESHNYNDHVYNRKTPIKDSFYYKYSKQAEWVENINFWKNTDGLEDLKEIHLMGGEPFLIPEHFEMLNELINKRVSKNIGLSYNTNATLKLTNEQIDVLKNFKSINISLSIDDVGKRFEYQRKNAVWEETVDVVDWVIGLHKSNALPNFKYILDPALSIFNVLYLEEIIEFTKLKNLFLHGTHFVPQNSYSVRTLHPDIKNKIVEKYADSKFKNEPIIKNVIEFLKNDEWSDQLDIERKDKTMFLDNARREKFTEVFPEMAKLLNYE